MNILKQNDVKKLIKYFTIPENFILFYEDIFKSCDEVENEDIKHFYDEDDQ